MPPLTMDALLGIISAFLGCAVTYGVLKTKVDRLEDDVHELSGKLDSSESRFVTMTHFDAVVRPLEGSIREIEKDIKKILVIVSRHHSDAIDQ
jgi:hypothetical protein